jgi:hypothetical protein
MGEVWRLLRPQIPLILFSVFHLESAALFVPPPSRFAFENQTLDGVRTERESISGL